MKLMKRSALALMFATFTFEAYAHKCEQSDPSLWDRSDEYDRVVSYLGNLFQCIDTSDVNEYTLRDRTACNWFVGKAVNEIYGVDSFKINNTNQYYLANEIAEKLAKNEFDGWVLIGAGNDQGALTLAGNKAELGQPVVAAWSNNAGHGHVSLVMPGGLQKSSAWNLEMPNSANMRLDNINSSYIGCRLSFAFGSDKKSNVALYSVN